MIASGNVDNSENSIIPSTPEFGWVTGALTVLLNNLTSFVVNISKTVLDSPVATVAQLPEKTIVSAVKIGKFNKLPSMDDEKSVVVDDES